MIPSCVPSCEADSDGQIQFPGSVADKLSHAQLTSLLFVLTSLFTDVLTELPQTGDVGGSLCLGCMLLVSAFKGMPIDPKQRLLLKQSHCP